MMMHPSNNIDKVYVAKIKGVLLPNEIMQLKNGVVIDGVKTAKSKLKVKKVDICESKILTFAFTFIIYLVILKYH